MVQAAISIPKIHKEPDVQNSQKQNIINVGSKERVASAITGGALVLYGMSHWNWRGLAATLIGGSLVYRGATGHCKCYEALRINTAREANDTVSVPSGAGIKVEKSVTINKSPEELYSFWREFQNLPSFMRHLESVNVIDEYRSHWIAKAPAGMTVEWDAEIINEKENELIAWRSTKDSQIPNAGSVRFIPISNGRGTEVKVSLSYDPPAGKIGSLFAKLFGEEASQQVQDDLRLFKQLMETGEVATIEGQTSGRAATAKQMTARQLAAVY